MAEITEANPAAEEVTDQTGEPTVTGEAVQETASIEEYEAKLRSYEARLLEEAAARQRAEEDKKRAQAEAARQEAIYRGFQKETTPKLQEYAKLKTEQVASREMLERLTRMEQLIEMQAAQFMSPEDKERFEISIERQRLENDRARLNAMQQQMVEAPSSPEPEPQVDLEQRKRDYFNRYFPNSQIELNDPRIDWALEATTYGDWESRFVTSVRTLEAEKSRQVIESEREAIQRAADEAARQARETAAAQAKQAREEAERVKAEAQETARVEKEEQLRRLGADMNPTSGPEAANLQRSLNELYPVDERWLTSGDPRDRKKYEDNLAQRQRALREARLARR